MHLVISNYLQLKVVLLALILIPQTHYLASGEVFCPPPFRRKVEGHCFWFSVGRGAWHVVRGSEFLVGTLSP